MLNSTVFISRCLLLSIGCGGSIDVFVCVCVSCHTTLENKRDVNSGETVPSTQSLYISTRRYMTVDLSLFVDSRYIVQPITIKIRTADLPVLAWTPSRKCQMRTPPPKEKDTREPDDAFVQVRTGMYPICTGTSPSVRTVFSFERTTRLYLLITVLYGIYSTRLYPFLSNVPGTR